MKFKQEIIKVLKMEIAGDFIIRQIISAIHCFFLKIQVVQSNI